MSGTCSKTSFETSASSDASPKLRARASSCRRPFNVAPLERRGRGTRSRSRSPPAPLCPGEERRRLLVEIGRCLRRRKARRCSQRCAMKRIRLLSLQPGQTSRSRKFTVWPLEYLQSPLNAIARAQTWQTPGKFQDSEPARVLQTSCSNARRSAVRARTAARSDADRITSTVRSEFDSRRSMRRSAALLTSSALCFDTPAEYLATARRK